MTEKIVKLRLVADGGQLVGEVRTSTRALDELADRTGKAGSAARRGASDLDRFGSAAERLSREKLSGLNSQLGRFGQLAAGLFSVDLARRAVNFADSYANIQARLELAAGSQERYRAAQERVFEIAQRTYTSLDSTAALYGKMQSATDQLGRSQETALRTTELINKTFQISGTEAGAASAAINQLAQGLGAGALRGDEFNSVMEQAPRLADALAKGLNVGRAELRAMANDGKLTADVIINALESQGLAIDKEFEKLPLTAARAWQQLENTTLRALGRINEQTSTTQALGQAIQGLAARIERVPVALEIWIEQLSRASEGTGGLYAAWEAVVDFLTGPAVDELMILPVTLSTLVTIAIGEFDKLRISAGEQFDLLLIGGRKAWNSLAEGAVLAGQNMGLAIGQAIDGILRRYAGMISAVATAAEGTGLDSVAGKLRQTADAVLGYATAEETAASKIAASRAHYLVLNDTLTLQEALVKGVAQAQRDAADGAIQASLDERDAALTRLNTEQKAAVAADDHTRKQGRLGAAIGDTAKKTRGMSAELRAYVDACKEAERASEDLARMGERLHEQNERLREKLRGLTDQQIDYNATIRQADAALAAATEVGTGWMLAVERYNTVVAEANEELRLRNELEAKNDAALSGRRNGYEGLSSAAQHYAEMVGEAAGSIWDDWMRLWESGEDRASAYWDTLVDGVRRAVAEILFEWAKTAIVGSFNGSGGWIGAAVSAFAGSGYSGGGSAGNTAAQIGMDVVSGSGGGSFSIFDGASWISAGRNLYTGFSQFLWGSQTATSVAPYAYPGLGGYGTASGSQLGMVPNYYGGAPGTAAGGYTPGIGTYAAGVAGAYYGFTQRGNGGSSSIAAGASYGALGLASAGAIGGAMAGTGAIAGASSALALGTSAAWVPVVGWILAILALVDVVAGGKLFGTKARTEYLDAALNIGPDGSSSTLTKTTVRQRSLWGGHDWETYTGAGDAEMDEAAKKFFDAMRKAMLKVARATGEELAPMIEASLRTVNKFDKHGKVIGTTYVAEVRGEEIEEKTAELAVMRIQAEAILEQLGDAAVRTAERWRDSAEVLMEGATLLVAVQTDIANGNALFGELSLDAVATAVEDLQQGNETLVETYARLSGSVADVKDAFALAGAELTKTGAALVQFAADMATEAGGGDTLNQLWQGFFQGFYNERELALRQLDKLKPQLALDLDGLGLAENTTMQQFRDAFEAALPSLTAEQVVNWLRVGQTLATVNGLLVQTGGSLQQLQASQRGYAEMVVGLDQQFEGLNGRGPSAFQQVLAQIGAQSTATAQRLTDLARAAGLTAARTEDLTRVQQIAAMTAAQAAQQLEAVSRDIVTQLWGNTAVEQRAVSAGSALQGVANGLEAVQSAADSFRNSVLLDDQLSPFSGNTQKLFEEAMRQLGETGSEELGRRVLEIGRRLRSTGADYASLVDQVTALIRPQVSQEVGSIPAGAGPAVQQQQLSEAQRLTLAQQLAQNVADLAGFGGRTFDDVADTLGFTLTQLGAELGLQGDALTEYLEAMQAESYGLDDLSGLITGQVDRLVEAIASGGAMPLAPDPDGDGKPVVPPPTMFPPADGQPTGGKSTPADADEIRVAIADMAERLEVALATLVRATNANGESTQSAIGAVADEARETVRELRQLTESLHINGGLRAATSLA